MSSPAVSFEYFPPRSPVQARRFWSTFGALQTQDPEYVSMTWGALGTSSQASVDILEALLVESRVPVAAHLTCVGHTEHSIRETIASLVGMGITRFVALRGDRSDDAQPGSVQHNAYAQGGEASKKGPALLQHASELVAILAEDPSLDISVAAYPEQHPESTSSQQDLQWLKHKLDMGAKRAITQFFFSADTFLRFRDRAVSAGISQALVPGILPVHDIARVQEFAKQCGAHVPEDMVKRFDGLNDETATLDCAVDQCVGLIEQLSREGVEHVHLYTLNQTTLSYRVCQALKGNTSSAVHAAA